MDVLCSYCNAKHFAAEKVFNEGNSFNECCGHGTVKLEAIPDFPDNYVHYSKIIINKVKHFLNVFGITIVHFRLHPLMLIKLICLQ